MSPTARSLKFLRERGYMAQVVERFNPGARVRVDLFNFIDILAIRDGVILGVQSCTVGDQAKRAAKIKSAAVAPKADLWLRAGGLIEVQGWGKKGARGKRKTWQVTVTEIQCVRPIPQEAP